MQCSMISTNGSHSMGDIASLPPPVSENQLYPWDRWLTRKSYERCFRKNCRFCSYSLNWINFLPAPGIMANLVSGNPTFAVVDAILKSQARASSIPPPNAAPSIAQIVGTGTSLNWWNSILAFETNNGTSASVIFLRSFRSAPNSLNKRLGSWSLHKLSNRRQISVLILSKFKRINQLLFPLKSSENLRLIHLNLLNIRGEDGQRYLTIT